MLTLLSFLTTGLMGLTVLATRLAFFSPLLSLWICLAGLVFLAILFLAAFQKIFSRDEIPWLSLILGLPALVSLGGLGYLAFLNPLHDITTEPTNPPLFLHPAYAFRVEKGAEYLEESLQLKRDYNPADAPAQVRLYPGFSSIPNKIPPAEAYGVAVKVIQSQFPAWKIVRNDENAHHLEVEAEDPVFQFVTDLALEARGDPAHPFDSKTVMRSRLRFDWMDLGWDLTLLRDLQFRLNLAMAPLQEQFAQRRADFEANGAKPAAPPAVPSTPPAAPKPISQPTQSENPKK